MNPKFGRRSWIKLWVNEWLDGTTRFEMSDAQRAFWIDLLAMAGRSRYPGIICAGKSPEGKYIGYPINKYQSLMSEPLNVEETLALFERKGKITVEPTADSPLHLLTLKLVSWDKYQSEYQRQKPYREKYREQTLAGQRVLAAVQSGKLEKPKNCTSCGKKKPLEGHHHNGYSEEYILDVIWLCKQCHENTHHNQLQAGYSESYTVGDNTEVEVEVETEVEVDTEEAVAAFAAISCKPFGSKKFKAAWTDMYQNKPTASWADTMEILIQFCKKESITVPGRFFAHKREIEKVEAEQAYKRTPL